MNEKHDFKDRKKVILTNLSNAYPHKSEKEIKLSRAFWMTNSQCMFEEADIQKDRKTIQLFSKSRLFFPIKDDKNLAQFSE